MVCTLVACAQDPDCDEHLYRTSVPNAPLLPDYRRVDVWHGSPREHPRVGNWVPLVDTPDLSTLDTWVVDGDFTYEGVPRGSPDDACTDICFTYDFDVILNALVIDDFTPAPASVTSIRYRAIRPEFRPEFDRSYLSRRVCP